jgi:hypothetical protein
MESTELYCQEFRQMGKGEACLHGSMWLMFVVTLMFCTWVGTRLPPTWGIVFAVMSYCAVIGMIWVVLWFVANEVRKRRASVAGSAGAV